MENRNDKFDLLICIVNKGTTDLVMNAARKAGATGGTIAVARGTGNPDLAKFYGLAIQPEKEMVFIVVKKEVKDAAEINAAMKEASETYLKDVLGYTDDPIVSRDILGRTEGGIYNGDQTKVFTSPEGTQLVKVFAWYDNEYSYTCQYVRLAKLFGQKLAA